MEEKLILPGSVMAKAETVFGLLLRAETVADALRLHDTQTPPDMHDALAAATLGTLKKITNLHGGGDVGRVSALNFAAEFSTVDPNFWAAEWVRVMARELLAELTREGIVITKDEGAE